MKKQKDEVMENGETEKCKKNIWLKFHSRKKFLFLLFYFSYKIHIKLPVWNKITMYKSITLCPRLGLLGQSHMD